MNAEKKREVWVEMKLKMNDYCLNCQDRKEKKCCVLTCSRLANLASIEIERVQMDKARELAEKLENYFVVSNVDTMEERKLLIIVSRKCLSEMEKEKSQ